MTKIYVLLNMPNDAIQLLLTLVQSKDKRKILLSYQLACDIELNEEQDEWFYFHRLRALFEGNEPWNLADMDQMQALHVMQYGRDSSRQRSGSRHFD